MSCNVLFGFLHMDKACLLLSKNTTFILMASLSEKGDNLERMNLLSVNGCTIVVALAHHTVSLHLFI